MRTNLLSSNRFSSSLIVFDDHKRPAIIYYHPAGSNLYDIHGDLYVKNDLVSDAADLSEIVSGFDNVKPYLKDDTGEEINGVNGSLDENPHHPLG